MRRLIGLVLLAVAVVCGQGCALLLLPSAVDVGAAVGVEVDQVKDWLRGGEGCEGGA
jgi:hypothetical protein